MAASFEGGQLQSERASSAITLHFHLLSYLTVLSILAGKCFIFTFASKESKLGKDTITCPNSQTKVSEPELKPETFRPKSKACSLSPSCLGCPMWVVSQVWEESAMRQVLGNHAEAND